MQELTPRHGAASKAWLCRNENFGQPIGPASLAFRIVNLVVANFDHRRRQTPRPGMAFDRVIDLVGRRIGLVDADGQRGIGL